MTVYLLSDPDPNVHVKNAIFVACAAMSAKHDLVLIVNLLDRSVKYYHRRGDGKLFIHH